MLKGVPLAPNFPMHILAEFSRGKSGSDLKELCRNAAMLPVRELVRQAKGDVALLARSQDEVRIRLLSVDLIQKHFLHRALNFVLLRSKTLMIQRALR